MTYNYREVLKADIKDALESYVFEEVVNESARDHRPYWDVFEEVQNYLWDDDHVTGYPSGSYTMNTAEAQEYLKDNWGMMVEAAEAYGIEPTVSDGYDHGPEWWDVTIRCYLLNEVLREVFTEEDYRDLVDRLEEEEVEEVFVEPVEEEEE